MSQSNADIAENRRGHQLQKELGLRDLVPMQILLVVGVTWAGLAARQGSNHVAFWLVGIATLFLPVAGVVTMHYLLRGTPQDLVPGALTIGAEAYFVMVARRLHTSALSALEARAQTGEIVSMREPLW